MSTLRILHLSDLHVYGGADLQYGVVDTCAALERVLARVDGVRDVAVVIASGDLSEDFTAASYERIRDAVEPWAARHGARTLYAMGNHDHRETLESVLGPSRQTLDIDGFRIVVLDSAVPGVAWGEVSADQLDDLRETLRQPASNGTVVVVHHPPVPALTTLLATMPLRNTDELIDTCRDTDVRLILSGHYHLAGVSEVDGITVSIAPAIANVADVAASPGHERALVGSGCAIVDLSADGTVCVTPVAAGSPADGTEIYDLDESQVAAIAASHGLTG